MRYLPLFGLLVLSTASGNRHLPVLADNVETVSAEVGSAPILHCPLEFPGGVVRPNTVRWFKQGDKDPIYLRQEGEEPHVRKPYAGRLTSIGHASLALDDVREDDYGWYMCHSFVQSDVDVDDVQSVAWALLESPEVKLQFLEEPRSLIVLPREEVTLRCATSPPAQLVWMRDDERVNGGDDEFLIANDGAALTLRPATGDRRGSLGGVYRCLAKVADLTFSSRPGHVRVAAMQPFPVFPDVTVEVAEGNLAVLPCHAPLSTPEGVTRISKDGHRIASDRVQRLQNGDFQVQSVRKNDEGAYRCSLENAALNISVEPLWKIHLVVTVPEGPLPTQLVVTPKQYLAVPLQVNVTLQCRANGTPLPVIKWSKYGGDLPQQRHVQSMGTLSLRNIQAADEGTYVCQAENGYGRLVSSFTILKIQKLPALVRELHLQNHTANEGTTFTLDCSSKGEPEPNVTWVHNGDAMRSSDRMAVKESKLVLKKVSMHDAGIYQCFASNDVGSVQSATRLRIFPKMTTTLTDGQRDSSSSDPSSHSNLPGPHPGDKSATTQSPFAKHDRPGSRKPKLSTAVYKSKDKMVPPSRPEITKLSDESVMVRWTVPENDGLPISFFKLQYKDVSRTNSRWMTIDDEIAAHIHSFEVSNLKLGHHYKFRIAAVYSNNDNKLGVNSIKFHLQKDPPMKIPMTAPKIMHAEAVGPTAILIRWEYVRIDMIPIEGFFIYYREITSAGSYNKVTVVDGKSTNDILNHLQSKVTYEMKMQSFNLAGTSDFSNIWTQATLDYPYSRSDAEIQVATAEPVREPCNEKVYMVLSITLAVLVVLFLIVFFYYARKHCQRHQTSDMVVHKIKKYDDAFHPTEFELQSLTGMKALNGNTSPTTNGHFLINGRLSTKLPDANVSPEADLPGDDDEDSFNGPQNSSKCIGTRRCRNRNEPDPGEGSRHSGVSAGKISLSTFGKRDDETLGCSAEDSNSFT